MVATNEHEVMFLDYWSNNRDEPLCLDDLIGASVACPLVICAMIKDVSALLGYENAADAICLIPYASKLHRDYGLLPVKDFSAEPNNDVYREIQRRQHVISLTSVWIANFLRVVEPNIHLKNVKQIYQNTQICILFYFFGWYGGEPKLSLKQNRQIKKLVEPYGNAWHLNNSLEFQYTKLKSLLQMIHILGMEYTPHK